MCLGKGKYDHRDTPRGRAQGEPEDCQEASNGSLPHSPQKDLALPTPGFQNWTMSSRWESPKDQFISQVLKIMEVGQPFDKDAKRFGK